MNRRSRSPASAAVTVEDKPVRRMRVALEPFHRHRNGERQVASTSHSITDRLLEAGLRVSDAGFLEDRASRTGDAPTVRLAACVDVGMKVCLHRCASLQHKLRFRQSRLPRSRPSRKLQSNLLHVSGKWAEIQARLFQAPGDSGLPMPPPGHPRGTERSTPRARSSSIRRQLRALD